MDTLPRKQLPPEHFRYLLVIGLTFFTFFIAIGFYLVDLERQQGSSYPLTYLKRLYHLDSQVGRKFFSQVIPGFKRYRFEDDPDFILDTKTADLILRFLVNIRNPSPREMFKAQFPLLARTEMAKTYTLRNAATHRPVPEPNTQRPAPLPPTRPAPTTPPVQPPRVEPTRILIYHTHTSESYVPVSGRTHNHNNRGDIVQAGAFLAKLLEDKYGIKTLHCDNIHDYYPFRDAYQRSAETVQKLLAEHPQVEVVLDLHRDATPGLNHKVPIKGKTAAKIILVVGSDRLGLPHPNWEKNHHFANSLLEVMDLLYPNLAHGVILAEARYNQHLHPQSIIVEFGDDKSTWEEVTYSLELFAEVLATYLSQASYSM
ncbi:MAG TPA: stage II sporulation protein P [Firmicutes bacterium]|uniref:Stage II sporulation protein P n=1 Tax=Capillibacterium thermochitinicola TaxID=2699427 RepID=A0A8J6HYR0_9FIRM|nr:stage II sporulation protein P [Capillibacterium thermochitinicola]MBA2132330.1 stage II sporulation protein P [Capillibacterium thermochitinicola]HHW12610.1 stage II sporulation protein P [Bacillota bacterium]